MNIDNAISKALLESDNRPDSLNDKVKIAISLIRVSAATSTSVPDTVLTSLARDEKGIDNHTKNAIADYLVNACNIKNNRDNFSSSASVSEATLTREQQQQIEQMDITSFNAFVESLKDHIHGIKTTGQAESAVEGVNESAAGSAAGSAAESIASQAAKHAQAAQQASLDNLARLKDEAKRLEEEVNVFAVKADVVVAEYEQLHQQVINLPTDQQIDELHNNASLLGSKSKAEANSILEQAKNYYEQTNRVEERVSDWDKSTLEVEGERLLQQAKDLGKKIETECNRIGIQASDKENMKAEAKRVIEQVETEANRLLNRIKSLDKPKIVTEAKRVQNQVKKLDISKIEREVKRVIDQINDRAKRVEKEVRNGAKKVSKFFKKL